MGESSFFLCLNFERLFLLKNIFYLNLFQLKMIGRLVKVKVIIFH